MYKAILIKLAKPIIIAALEEMLNILEAEAKRTENEYDDETVKFVRTKMLKFVREL